MSPTAHHDHKAHGEKWSKEVTEHSDAMDLEDDVFEGDDPHEIALSLKRSAEHSHRRKSEPYQSAMSMLTFYSQSGGRQPQRAQEEGAGGCQGRAAEGVRARRLTRSVSGYSAVGP